MTPLQLGNSSSCDTMDCHLNGTLHASDDACVAVTLQLTMKMTNQKPTNLGSTTAVPTSLVDSELFLA